MHPGARLQINFFYVLDCVLTALHQLSNAINIPCYGIAKQHCSGAAALQSINRTTCCVIRIKQQLGVGQCVGLGTSTQHAVH